jgi:hypothetical protein
MGLIQIEQISFESTINLKHEPWVPPVIIIMKPTLKPTPVDSLQKCLQKL